MYKNIPRIWLVLAGAFLFNILFWKEDLGLNTLLYDLFLVASLLVIYPEARKSTPVKWLLLMQSVCAVMLVVLHTELSIFALFVLLPLFASFAAYSHRSLPYAGGSMLFNCIPVMETIFSELGQLRKARKKNRLAKLVTIGLIPVLIALVFFLFYVGSNSVLASFTERLFIRIGNLLSTVFSSSLIGRSFFLLLGLYVTGWMLLRSRSIFMERQEAREPDQLVRTPKIRRSRKEIRQLHPDGTRSGSTFYPLMMGLKKEYIMGVICLVLLNGLLLVENLIDITYVWFSYGENRGLNFSEEVHNGTDLLIISIICAMLVLLLFFKGNLNFYQKNRWLKILAYAWIIQNIVLAGSVLIRDIYYITHFGLYYKRIGVLFFLAMVLGGLITMYLKVRYQKTLYYLVRVNAWVVVALMVAGTTVSWDELIVSYNIRNTDPAWIDWDYLLRLSDKTIPQLAQDTAIVKFRQSAARPDYQYTRIAPPDYLGNLAMREKAFVRQQQADTWLSWNWADHRLSRSLLHLQLLSKK